VSDSNFVGSIALRAWIFSRVKGCHWSKAVAVRPAHRLARRIWRGSVLHLRMVRVVMVVPSEISDLPLGADDGVRPTDLPNKRGGYWVLLVSRMCSAWCHPSMI
jgi:hypothetical protein